MTKEDFLSLPKSVRKQMTEYLNSDERWTVISPNHKVSEPEKHMAYLKKLLIEYQE
jgi:hypothetical protein